MIADKPEHGHVFKEGDKVRDSAQVGGQVLETWGNGVKVCWRNGHTGWIDARFLTPEPPK